MSPLVYRHIVTAASTDGQVLRLSAVRKERDGTQTRRVEESTNLTNDEKNKNKSARKQKDTRIHQNDKIGREQITIQK
jgi:hypothetical protein